MSQWDKIGLLIRAQCIGFRALPVFAFIALSASVGMAVDIAQVNDALDAGSKAGEMTPSAIWATVAIAAFICMILLGWGVFTIGTRLQTTMATMAADLASIKDTRSQCPASEHMHTLLNAARTEIERTGAIVSGGRAAKEDA